MAQLQEITPRPRRYLSMTLHLGYSMVTKGHKLTGVKPVAKTNLSSQTSHLQLNQETCLQALHLLHTTNQIN
jgi:hypothetical protein